MSSTRRSPSPISFSGGSTNAPQKESDLGAPSKRENVFSSDQSSVSAFEPSRIDGELVSVLKSLKKQNSALKDAGENFYYVKADRKF